MPRLNLRFSVLNMYANCIVVVNVSNWHSMLRSSVIDGRLVRFIFLSLIYT